MSVKDFIAAIVKGRGPKGEPAREREDNILKLVKEGESDKSQHMSRWDYYLKFLRGRQNLRKQAGSWEYEEVESNQVAGDDDTIPVINLILPNYLSVMSSLLTNFPGVRVVPNSDSSEDLVKASSLEMLLRSWWMLSDFDAKVAEGNMWAAAIGSGYLIPQWDKDKGVVPEVVSCRQVVPEPGVEEFEDSEWVAVVTYPRVEDLIGVYPDKGKSLREAEKSWRQQYDEGNGDTTETPLERVKFVRVFWNDGTFSFWVEGHEGPVSEGDTGLGEMPVVQLPFVKLPGFLWPMGMVEGQCTLQWQYNELRWDIHRNAKVMANPLWKAPKNSGLPSYIEGKPGQVMTYNPAVTAPEQVKGAEMPQQVYVLLRQIPDEMQRLAFAPNTAQGRAEGSVRSADQVEQLQEARRAQLEMVHFWVGEALQKFARLVVKSYQKNATKDFLARAFDDSGFVMFEELDVTNLDMEADVYIEVDALWRDTWKDREKRIFQELTQGLITPQHAIRLLRTRRGISYDYFKRVKAISKAKDFLEEFVKPRHNEAGDQVLPTLLTTASDDIEAYIMVFDEFTASERFDELTMKAKRAIHELIVTLESRDLPDDEYRRRLAHTQIFPRQMGLQRGAPGGAQPFVDQPANAPPQEVAQLRQAAETAISGQGGV